ncbi:hypothetical protein I7I48_11425 [Histoplasma ohiense]|nr:hypothetical protein I7I48_11425 [Histoplasma ohiense (nom. inval.)]
MFMWPSCCPCQLGFFLPLVFSGPTTSSVKMSDPPKFKLPYPSRLSKKRTASQIYYSLTVANVPCVLVFFLGKVHLPPAIHVAFRMEIEPSAIPVLMIPNFTTEEPQLKLTPSISPG